MPPSKLSKESTAGEERQNKLDDYGQKALFEKINELQETVEQIQENQKKALGGDQPSGSNQITVWKNDGPGHPKIGKVISEVKKSDEDGLQRLSAGEVESIVERSRSRTLEIMRELDRKHPDLKHKNFGGNRGSYLYWMGD